MLASLCILGTVASIANPAAKTAEFIAAVEGMPRASELLDEALASPDQAEAAAVIRAAVLHGSEDMREQIASETPELPLMTRLAVHSAFAELGDARLEADLQVLFGSENDSVRVLVLPFFAHSGTEKSLPLLLTALESGNSSFVRAVESVIVRMDLSDSVDDWTSGLSSASDDNRAQAIQLASIRNREGTEQRFMEMLTDPAHAEVHDAVVAGLARVGTFETGRLLLQLIGEAENAVAARPFQAAFRRISPRLTSEIPMLWEQAFMPQWNAADTDEIRTALLLMVPALRSGDAAEFLLELIRNNEALRGWAMAQLRVWDRWPDRQIMLDLVKIERLSDRERMDAFRMANRFLTDQVRAPSEGKQEYAEALWEAAPTTEIRAFVEQAIRANDLTVPDRD